MAVFFSFHYKRDAWRVQEILRMGALEGQTVLNAQEWESVERQGPQAIERWIDSQMSYKTAVVVLIGAQTAGRPWVRHEIEKAWNEKRRLVGVRINGLADQAGMTDSVGSNPFEKVTLQGGGTVADYVPVHTPSGLSSRDVYGNIKANLASWVADGYKRG